MKRKNSPSKLVQHLKTSHSKELSVARPLPFSALVVCAVSLYIRRKNQRPQVDVKIEKGKTERGNNPTNTSEVAPSWISETSDPGP